MDIWCGYIKPARFLLSGQILLDSVSLLLDQIGFNFQHVSIIE